jgi:hypothetical protein
MKLALALVFAAMITFQVAAGCGGKQLGNFSEAGAPDQEASGGTTGAGGSAGFGGGGIGGTGGFGSGGSEGDSGSDSGSETLGDSGTEDSGSSLVDAAGLLPPACEACLASRCTSSYDTCLEDPQCVAILECVVHCDAEAGSQTSCAIDCTMASDSSAAGSQTLELLECAESKCAHACSNADGG